MRADRPSIPEVLDRFRAYHAKHPTWGALHVILEDGNTSDAIVRDCAEHTKGDWEGKQLAAILLQMSPTQRGRLAKIA